MNQSTSLSHRTWHNYIAERDELFQKSRSISVTEMATTLAHELNQPLGTVSNILQGLQVRLSQGVLNVEQCQDAIALALQQTQFASRVISRVRDSTESRQPKYVQFNVIDLLNHSVQLLDWVFSAESVRVTLSDAGVETASAESKDLPIDLQIVADYTMMQQVVTNLLRNAVDAIREANREERVIRIALGRTPDGIKIEIKDNGHGLKTANVDSLFTPFQSAKKDGMGVGLNICKSFVELHQGKLWVTPNVDVGCTAHVLLRSRQSSQTKKNTSEFQTIAVTNTAVGDSYE